MNNILDTLLQSQFVQSNTLNFLLVLVFLLWIISKLNIGQKLQQTNDKIKYYISEAEEEKLQAEARLSEINKKIENLPEEIKEIERSVKNGIESLTAKSKRDVENQMQDIDNNVKRIMDLETKKFKQKLTAVVSEASVNLARDNALSQLENNREIHDKYIYDAIDEIDGMNLWI